MRPWKNIRWCRVSAESYGTKLFVSCVKYRLGAYYSKPYYKIDGVRAADEYGVTAGFGLPIPRTRSVLSLSAQYVRTKGTQAAFLNENTLRICIGVTFNERWFFKSVKWINGN